VKELVSLHEQSGARAKVSFMGQSIIARKAKEITPPHTTIMLEIAHYVRYI